MKKLKYKTKMRYDVIEVYLNEEKEVQRIMHLENAFNYDTAHRYHR